MTIYAARRPTRHELKEMKAFGPRKKMLRFYIEMSAEGFTVPQIAERTGSHAKTVRKWIKLWNEKGLEGLKTVIPRKVPYVGSRNRNGIRSSGVLVVRRRPGLRWRRAVGRRRW